MKHIKKCIVLGGGGFIGGHLAKRLKDQGCHVRIARTKNYITNGNGFDSNLLVNASLALKIAQFAIK